MKLLKCQSLPDKYKMTWEKISKGQVEVCFNADFNEYRIQVENQLKQSGLQAIRRTFDIKNNKIYITYRKR